MVDVAGKRVFISGPMTSVGHLNVPAFVDAHLALLDAGAAAVYDPAAAWLMETRLEEGARLDGHEDCMLACVHELTDGLSRYDLLVRLPGWEDSPGARLESLVADQCGIPTADLVEVKP